jgi:hypothetical protein
MMLSAIPETTWLPWCVMQAKPCTMASPIEKPMAVIRPTMAEPVTAALAAAANAAPSILPSSAMSTMPERSANRPASAASTSGVASRMVESERRSAWRKTCSMAQATASAGFRRANSTSSEGRNMCSRAPANRMTRPWITTTMSRLSAGMSKESSEPP